MSARHQGPSGVVEGDTPKLFRTVRIRKWGHAAVLTLPKPIRVMLGAEVGDEVAFRKLGRYVVIAVIRPFQVMPFSDEEKRKAVEAVGD